MKRFISLLLCLILPFMCLCPLSSNAFDVQGTEYPDPSLLPIDVNFDYYDYYFLTVSGSSSNPTYYFYFVKDNSESSSNRLYFTVNLSPSSTCLRKGSFTSFGTTTNYSCTRFSYSSSGTWNSSSPSDFSLYWSFIFDEYSDFSSSDSNHKYIIASNADIYDYSGTLVRSGDYETLCSYFRNGLSGSSDRTEKPEPTTSGGSSGSVSIDFGNIPDLLGNVINSLDVLATAIDSMTTAVSTKIISDKLDNLKEIVSNIEVWLSTIHHVFTDYISNFDTKINDLDLHITKAVSDFQQLFFEFSSVNGEIKKLAELFSSINQAISIMKQGLEGSVDTITTDFNNFAEDVKDNVASIRMIVNDFTLKFDTIISKLNSIIDSFSDISSKLSDCYSELHDISYYSKWINNNLKDGLNEVIDQLSGIIEIIAACDARIDKLLDDIHSMIFNCYIRLGILNSSIIDLPDSFGELLKDLFIPKEDHFSKFTDEINEHFGFVYQILELCDVLVKSAEFDYVEPSYTLDVDSDTFGRFSINTFDFSAIAPYVEYFRNFNTGVVLYLFIRRTRRRLPEIINGLGVTN